jgi:integrase
MGSRSGHSSHPLWSPWLAPVPPVVPVLWLEVPEEEVRALCQAATSQYRPIVTTLAWTGLRVWEALALRWSDVGFETQEIRVHSQLDEKGPC